MKNVLNEKTIYIDRNNPVPIGKVKSESDVVLNIKLLKDNKILTLNNQKIKIVAKLPNNKTQEQISDITQESDNIKIKLNKSIISISGIVELELYANDSEGTLITPTFSLEVLDSFLDSETLESTDYISSLEILISNFNVRTKEVLDNFVNKSNLSIGEFKDNSSIEVNKFINNSSLQLKEQEEDYDSLKKIIINENQAANLQSQINVNKDDIKILKDEQPMWSKKEGVGQVTFDNTFNGVAKSSIIYGKTIGGYNAVTGQSDSIASTGQGAGEDNKLLLRSCGKNLIDFKKAEFLNSAVSHPNVIIDNGVRIYRFTSSFLPMVCKVYLKAGMQYKPSGTEVKSGHSLEMHFMVYKDKVMKHNSSLRSSFNCTESGWYEVGFEMSGTISNPGVAYTDFTNIMLEEGTLASKYEPYIEDKKEILLPCPHRGLERKQNEYNSETGKYKENIDKITLDGRNYTFSKWTNKTWYLPFNKIAKNGLRGSVISDKFTNRSFSEIFGTDIEGICTQESESRILINTNEADLNAWLQQNPVTVVYELAKPTVHNIEKMRINTYNGTTHFIQDNEIKGNISFEVAVDRDARIEVNDINIKSNKTDIEVCNKAIDINRLDILSNANSIEEIILALAECIKKDGSTEIIDSLKVSPPKYGGFLLKNESGNTFKVITTNNNLAYAIQIHVNGEEASRNVVEVNTNAVTPGSSDIQLGYDTVPFKDVWVGSVNKSEHGFNFETNGMVKQWGRASIHFGDINHASSRINFPLLFNSIKTIQITINGNDGGWGNADFVSASFTRGNNFFDVVINTRNGMNFTGNVGIDWEATGY